MIGRCDSPNTKELDTFTNGETVENAKKPSIYSPVTLWSCSSKEDPDVDEGGAGCNIMAGDIDGIAFHEHSC